jgi:hypothetical protein
MIKLIIRQLISGHLLSLPLSQKKILIKNIFGRCLNNSTFNYQIYMKNSLLCEHYHIQSKRLNVTELAYIDIKCCVAFLRIRSILNFYAKMAILLRVHLKKLHHLIKKRIK